MRHKKALRTHKPKVHMAIRVTSSLRDLVRVAALRQEISQTRFVSDALEKSALRLLVGKEKDGQMKKAHGAEP